MRRELVGAVRRGLSLREAARRFSVCVRTVLRWVARAKDKRLDRVDWSDRASGPRAAPKRTPRSLENHVLALRRELKEKSALGEYGAAAIRRALLEEGASGSPCERTIHRILERRGALDGARRIRRKPPPPGWYLADVADRTAELDEIDIIEGLLIRGGSEVEVLNIASLHGGLFGSWPSGPIRAKAVREALIEHWRAFGLPAYAQFDNDTRFLGPSNNPDVIGSVARLCLCLDVVPVFAPPRETGIQAAIESFNGRWQAKIWRRFQHESLEALMGQTDKYIGAARKRNAVRIEGAPIRRPFPQDWTLTRRLLEAPPKGRLIFIRRTSDKGEATVLGRSYAVDQTWPNRLTRCVVDLDAGRICFYALRRRDPSQQPLLAEVAYTLPERKFRLSDIE